MQLLAAPPAGVLFVDVDGTLVGPQGVAPRVWPALARLRDAGWRVALCTGRPGRGEALAYAREADAEGLHVFESGAVVVRGDGALVHADALPAAAVARALAVGDEVGATVEVYTATGTYHARERDRFIAEHEELLGLAAVIGPIPLDAPIVRVQWVVDAAAWTRLEPLVPTLSELSVHVGRSPLMPDARFVAATAPGVSKATGMQRVLERYAVPAAGAAMCGDNLNDLTGLRLVGTAFVAADGAAEAIAVAHHVVPGPAEGGVADAAGILLARGAARRDGPAR